MSFVGCAAATTSESDGAMRGAGALEGSLPPKHWKGRGTAHITNGASDTRRAVSARAWRRGAFPAGRLSEVQPHRASPHAESREERVRGRIRESGSVGCRADAAG